MEKKNSYDNAEIASISTAYSNEEIDRRDHEIDYDHFMNHEPAVSELYRFLNREPITSNGKNNPNTNIFDRLKGGMYTIPPHKIPGFFTFYDACRKISKVRPMFAEKQSEYSGIMLDFDIYQKSETSLLDTQIFQNLVQEIMFELFNIIQRPSTKQVVQIGIFQRPNIKTEDGIHKDGIHLIIPGIKIMRGVKKCLIDRLISEEKLDKIFEDIEPADKRPKSKAPNVSSGPVTRSQFLDRASSYVPVFLYGSASKSGGCPYNLVAIYSATIKPASNSGAGDITVTYDHDFIKKIKKANISYEFSINYEGEIIKKNNYEVNAKYADQINNSIAVTDDENEQLRVCGYLSTESIKDPMIAEIRQLLNLLSPTRSDNYDQWFAVLCALAHTSPTYKFLAEEFSQKSMKYSPANFEETWNNAMVSCRKKSLSLGSLNYWAKIDNPDGYKNVKKSTVYSFLLSSIYKEYKLGQLNDDDIATILHQLLQYKYVYDISEEDGSCWYEFILEDDVGANDCGRLYKWYRWENRRPDHLMPVSMSNYISKVLPQLFQEAINHIRNKRDNGEEKYVKLYQSVYNKFCKVTNDLGNSAVKARISRESCDKFYKSGFSRSLDKDPFVRGVANGVLKLSKAPGSRPHLIQGYHSYPVSKFMPAPYIKFDPRDPKTKKIMMVLRNLFPDNEPDTFEFVMNYLASTLDGNDKESMFVIMIGHGANGKSFLMEMHKGILGDHYGVKMKMAFLTDFSAKAGSADPDLMKLKEATFAYYSECNPGDVINMARIKEVTGMETIAGRHLFKNTVNFRPKCHHLCIVNHDFDIMSNDYGTWRRIVYIPLKITFVHEAERVNEEKNYRLANNEVNTKWTTDDEIKGRYLGILVWYHLNLYRKYGGQIQNVPHPHIKHDTMLYRQRQDKVAQFISQALVRTEDPNAEYPFNIECNKFINWFNENNPGKAPPKDIHDRFKNSDIVNYIKTTARGSVFLVGHRFVDFRNPKTAAEEYVYAADSTRDAHNNFGIESESCEQYYERICREYDQLKDLLDENAGQRDDTAAEIIINKRIYDEYQPLVPYVPASAVETAELSVPRVSQDEMNFAFCHDDIDFIMSIKKN